MAIKNAPMQKKVCLRDDIACRGTTHDYPASGDHFVRLDIKPSAMVTGHP